MQEKLNHLRTLILWFLWFLQEVQCWADVQSDFGHSTEVLRVQEVPQALVPRKKTLQFWQVRLTCIRQNIHKSSVSQVKCLNLKLYAGVFSSFTCKFWIGDKLSFTFVLYTSAVKLIDVGSFLNWWNNAWLAIKHQCCKSTFIRMGEIFTKYLQKSPIFLGAN